MKLTNKQLEVLSSHILDKIVEKNSIRIEEIKNSFAFKQDIDKFKKTKKFKIPKKIEENKEKIDNIVIEIDRLKDEYAKLYNVYDFSTPQTAKLALDRFTKEYIKKDINIPNIKEIEKKVVMNTINEDKDFVQNIINQY